MFKKVLKKILPKFIVREIRKFVKSYYDRKRMNAISVLESQSRQGLVLLDIFELGDTFLNDNRYYSQVYQDFYLDNFVFKKKERGFFLDVGGNDPIVINNTYFFEKERNWDGLAFEPMPKMNRKWKENRKVECLELALGQTSTTAEFCEYEEDYMSGMVEKVDYLGKESSRYFVHIEPLWKVLGERNICQVDFMSLDVEGAELDVLKGIDFEKVRIDYILIENNRSVKRKSEIRKFLIKKGYVFQARLWIDDIWRLNK